MRRIVWLAILAIALSGTAFSSGEAFAASAGGTGQLTQAVTGNGVTVTATLLKELPESTAIKLALDTYFLNLVRYDLEELAVLRDDTGKVYPLAAVERIGGRKPRYREAVLGFPKVAPEAKMIELIVKDVAGMKERTFHWSVTE